MAWHPKRAFFSALVKHFPPLLLFILATTKRRLIVCRHDPTRRVGCRSGGRLPGATCQRRGPPSGLIVRIG